ncbi:peptidoglycan-binding protein LysM [Ideonella sp.]|uniref:peptidoglycan-binding protein LysM n=1 Tax=Ideonella sp. TaxID=1929293 RepID=UPI0037BFAEA9
MGIVSFFKAAGEKLFGNDEAEKTAQAAAAAPSDGDLQQKVAQLNARAADAIATYVAGQGLSADGLAIEFDGATSHATVSGQAADQPTREKIVLCCGNVTGVTGVNDMMTVAQPADESRWYTVVKGDNLSKIAKEHYGNANEYPKIFEANRPMLGHPDKIYPGQLLRIPA